MNFGGGSLEDGKSKSRKEVFEEIIAKSKAFKMVHGEIKQANEELRFQLDEGFMDLLPLLNMNKGSRVQPGDNKTDKTYEQIAFSLRESERAMPS